MQMLVFTPTVLTLNKSLIPAAPSLVILVHTIQHEFIQLFSRQNRLRWNRQIARGKRCPLGDKLRVASKKEMKAKTRQLAAKL